MKKEKSVKTYQRRSKSGKMVTVRAYSAKYDAAEAAKKSSKKKGAGEELDSVKKKKSLLSEAKKAAKEEKNSIQKQEEETKYGRELSKEERKPKKAKETVSRNLRTKTPKEGRKVPKVNTPKTTFTSDEYKAWYHWDQEGDPKNKAANKVAKELRAKMGRSAYNKYFNEMSDKYSPRGHSGAFKKLGIISNAGDTSSTKKVSAKQAPPKKINLSKDEDVAALKKIVTNQTRKSMGYGAPAEWWDKQKAKTAALRKSLRNKGVSTAEIKEMEKSFAKEYRKSKETPAEKIKKSVEVSFTQTLPSRYGKRTKNQTIKVKKGQTFDYPFNGDKISLIFDGVGFHYSHGNKYSGNIRSYADKIPKELRSAESNYKKDMNAKYGSGNW